MDRTQQWRRASIRGHATNYKNVKILGEGNFGSVFLAQDHSVERMVAVKEINLQKQEIDWASNEIEAQRKCQDHENILNIFKCFENEDDDDNQLNFSIVMEYCELGNLFTFKGEYLEENGRPFSDRLCRSMMTQLASAVEHIHSKSIVHRDLKPENVLVTEGSTPFDICLKIGDFGVAKLVKSSAKIVLGNESIERVNMSTVAGTMGYWAPEVWQVYKSLTHDTTYTDRVDVFALGLIFVFIAEPNVKIHEETKAPMISHMGRHLSVGEYLIDHRDITIKQYLLFDASFDLQNLIVEMISKSPLMRPTSKRVLVDLHTCVRKIRFKAIDDPKDAAAELKPLTRRLSQRMSSRKSDPSGKLVAEKEERIGVGGERNGVVGERVVENGKAMDEVFTQESTSSVATATASTAAAADSPNSSSESATFTSNASGVTVTYSSWSSTAASGSSSSSSSSKTATITSGSNLRIVKLASYKRSVSRDRVATMETIADEVGLPSISEMSADRRTDGQMDKSVIDDKENRTLAVDETEKSDVVDFQKNHSSLEIFKENKSPVAISENDGINCNDVKGVENVKDVKDVPHVKNSKDKKTKEHRDSAKAFMKNLIHKIGSSPRPKSLIESPTKRGASKLGDIQERSNNEVKSPNKIAKLVKIEKPPPFEFRSDKGEEVKPGKGNEKTNEIETNLQNVKNDNELETTIKKPGITEINETQKFEQKKDFSVEKPVDSAQQVDPKSEKNEPMESRVNEKDYNLKPVAREKVNNLEENEETKEKLGERKNTREGVLVVPAVRPTVGKSKMKEENINVRNYDIRPIHTANNRSALEPAYRGSQPNESPFSQDYYVHRHQKLSPLKERASPKAIYQGMSSQAGISRSDLSLKEFGETSERDRTSSGSNVRMRRFVAAPSPRPVALTASSGVWDKLDPYRTKQTTEGTITKEAYRRSLADLMSPPAKLNQRRSLGISESLFSPPAKLKQSQHQSMLNLSSHQYHQSIGNVSQWRSALSISTAKQKELHHQPIWNPNSPMFPSYSKKNSYAAIAGPISSPYHKYKEIRRQSLENPATLPLPGSLDNARASSPRDSTPSSKVSTPYNAASPSNDVSPQIILSSSDTASSTDALSPSNAPLKSNYSLSDSSMLPSMDVSPRIEAFQSKAESPSIAESSVSPSSSPSHVPTSIDPEVPVNSTLSNSNGSPDKSASTSISPSSVNPASPSNTTQHSDTLLPCKVLSPSSSPSSINPVSPNNTALTNVSSPSSDLTSVNPESNSKNNLPSETALPRSLVPSRNITVPSNHLPPSNATKQIIAASPGNSASSSNSTSPNNADSPTNAATPSDVAPSINDALPSKASSPSGSESPDSAMHPSNAIPSINSASTSNSVSPSKVTSSSKVMLHSKTNLATNGPSLSNYASPSNAASRSKAAEPIHNATSPSNDALPSKVASSSILSSASKNGSPSNVESPSHNALRSNAAALSKVASPSSVTSPSNAASSSNNALPSNAASPNNAASPSDAALPSNDSTPFASLRAGQTNEKDYRRDSGVHSISGSDRSDLPPPSPRPAASKPDYAKAFPMFNSAKLFKGYVVGSAPRKTVVLKEIAQACLSSPETRPDLKEYELLRLASGHPSFHHAVDSVLNSGRWFAVFDDFEQRITLLDFVRGQKSAYGAVSSAKIGAILRQAADGVAFLHAGGVVHRALTPDNMSVCLKQKPLALKIGGFSLAVRVGDEPDSVVNILKYIVERKERRRDLMFFSAPEILSSSRPRHLPANDVFSLAILFMTLLETNSCGACGQGLFPGAHLKGPRSDVWKRIPMPPQQCLPAGLLLKADEGLEPVLQSAFVTETPASTRELVKRMMRAEAEGRPKAAEVAESVKAEAFFDE